MKQRCMLAYHKDSLLGNGMSSLLAEKAGLEVMTYKIDSEPQLFKAVRQWSPMVLVIETTCLEKSQGLVSRLLLQQEGLRVIVVSVQDNVVQVFDHHTIQVDKISDFLSVIVRKNESYPNQEKRIYEQ